MSKTPHHSVNAANLKRRVKLDIEAGLLHEIDVVVTDMRQSHGVAVPRSTVINHLLRHAFKHASQDELVPFEFKRG